MKNQHVVYRLYDYRDELLYVGVTGNLPHRMAVHKNKSSWYGEVRRTETTTCPDKAAAYALEAHAIQTENPRHNILQNLGKKPYSLSIPPELATAIDEQARKEGHNNFSAIIVAAVREYLMRVLLGKRAA